MNTNLILSYLDLRRLPVADEDFSLSVHRALCAESPRLHLALLADRSAHLSHLRLGLVTLLTHPVARQRISAAEITAQLHALPALRALEVVEALPLHRLNGRRARQVGLALLLGGPHLARWAATRRRRMIRLLRHLLGERTFSAVGRALTPPATTETERFLRRAVLRFAADVGLARQALAFLTGVKIELTHPDLARAAAARVSLAQGAGLPRETLMGLRGTYARDMPRSDVVKLSAVAEAPQRRDGPLTRALRAVLLGEIELPFTGVLDQAEGEAAKSLPAGLDGRLAVVLDLSASMASSGERQHHPASLALALVRLLLGLFPRVSVHRAGGRSEGLAQDCCPAPAGPTDLASAVLEAARERPEMMVLLTDGYENVRQGDAAQVLRGLGELGLAPALVQAVTVFTPHEDISERRIGADVPAVPVAHEAEVGELAARMMLARSGEHLEGAAKHMKLLEELLCTRAALNTEV